MIALVSTRWVLIEKFCTLTGYTPAGVRGKIQTGVWLKGIHFEKAPDNHILINLEAYERWVEGAEFEFAATGSRSASIDTANASKKH